ncbi:hypothetical protein BBF96_00975 [Anoxybacter fermentans]|uniref:EamA domain-containing protein n=1 Tax=Anoxybacter fermentans TaxID=1323375 RepID=A0A3Q9HNM7_9FIRM|nr:DMT family transporter [Anoxybacter fermentans]AZR72086.1 hypothetical protein BBF96_00975 [Anoxybacter fermentans]
MRQETRMHLAMIVSALFWAGAFIAGKIGVREFSPYELTFFRFLFATILIFIILYHKEKGNWQLERSLWPLTILLGLIGMFGYHVLFFTALKYTTAVNSSIIGATNPLITTILAAFFLGEYLSLKRMGAILLALLGVVLTVTNGDLSVLWNFTFNIGDIIMLGAVICWAIYSILSRRAKGRVSSLKLMTYVFMVCLIAMFPFVIYEKVWTKLLTISWQGWVSVIYMAVFPSVLGYLVQMASIRQIGASRTAVYVNLVPVFSMILSYFILHEPIGWFKFFTAGMIISGVYLSSKS